MPVSFTLPHTLCLFVINNKLSKIMLSWQFYKSSPCRNNETAARGAQTPSTSLLKDRMQMLEQQGTLPYDSAVKWLHTRNPALLREPRV